ncbi:MAG: sulfatase-like hydrolase/transferase [Acidobacteria bacterium]|nr:sulfatase-like hydrolase/transferase [Acidobacteriota bacterium]
MKRLLLLAGRGLVAAFVLLSSIYALLAYIPFTYQQVHKGGLLTQLTWFGHKQAQLYWIALALALATILPYFRQRRTRRAAILFAVVHTGGGVMLAVWPVMARLRNDAGSLTIAFVALVPLLWLAALDALAHAPAIEWLEYRKEDDRRIFRAVWHTALFLSIVYSAISWGRTGANPAGELPALGATTLCHLLIFGVLFAALNLVRSVASLTPWPSPAEFALSNLLTAGIGFAILKMLVFHPLSFEGRAADGYAALLAGALVATLAGLSLRQWTPRDGATGGLALALKAVSLPVFRGRWLQPVPLVGLAAAAWVLAVDTAIMDWNYMFQKLAACAIWVLAFAYLYEVAPRRGDGPDGRIAILFWAAMTMPVYRVMAANVAQKPKVAAALETYAGFDPSFRLIRDALSSAPGNGDFYAFLARNTNIPRSIPTAPVPIDPAGKLVPGAGAKPNIFIIVIDSLRRDYLGAYNSAVRFTPEIDAFARESTVFRNAFTRYGGTGLAEPSIWVGGMILHQQYVTPFYPMNALAKLVEAEGYRSYISMDTILRVIVKPPPGLVELDAGRDTMNYRLCDSLAELRGRLDGYNPASGPMFAYTQPQDIHISVINREGTRPVDGASYGSMYAPYASRVRRIDGCFGGFVQDLKARGMYDNSLIVLTADHGDSLGEDGRWGHAYTLVPEVVRVPLVVHLPKMYEGMVSQPQAVAFQSDITPSLYYLLGHPPTLRRDFYGRPLFTRTADEQKGAPDNYLIAASYAAVYGILGDRGRSLFVTDAVNYRDAHYDIGDGGAGSGGWGGITGKAESEALIRKQVEEIAAFYKFKEQ